MKLNQKNWSDPNKIQSRRENIIIPYREHIANKLLPLKQFWTLSGQCTDGNNPLEGCELLQMIEEQFITPDQYRGVELTPEIYKMNKLVYPNIQFINDDFYSAMKQSYQNNEFNPGIVNFDSTYLPERGITYLSDILYFLTDINIKQVLLIGNFAKMNPYGGHKRHEPNDMIKYLKKNDRFKYSFLKGGWKYYLISTTYKCKKSRTPFMSISFYRN